MSNDTLIVKLVDLPITALDREVMMKEQFCDSLSGRDLNDNAEIRHVRVPRSCTE